MNKVDGWIYENKTRRFDRSDWGYDCIDVEDLPGLIELVRLEERGKWWVSVDDELPDHDGSVLVWPYPCGEEARHTGVFQDCGWYEDIHGYEIEVTHWMPLPEPSK